LADAYIQFLFEAGSERFAGCFIPPWWEQVATQAPGTREQRWAQDQQMLAFLVPIFGGKTVPWTFNKAISPFVTFVRFLYVRLWGYFDDFVALDQSQGRLDKIGQNILKPLIVEVELEFR
jgi:hypothetical protein